MKNSIFRNRFKIYILFVFIGFTFLPSYKNPCYSQSNTNEASYKTIIQQADQALAAKEYAGALLYYKKASQVKPDDNYATDKINEINTILDANPDSKAQLFEDLILKAENLFNQKDYPKAKSEYLKALEIDPTAQFPKDRLTQISTMYSDPEDQAAFNQALATGDKALAKSDFEKAIQSYETALVVKPNTKSVKDKIAAAKKQQSDYKIIIENAANSIASADRLFEAGKRAEARAEYQKALDMTPDNQYASLKIQEIDNYTKNQKAFQDAYDNAIDQADQFYINRDFASARLKYQEALKAKPEARYPKEMLEKTKSGESQLQSDQQKYDAVLASAENFLKSSDYESALQGFKSAIAIKPAETYPKTKIADIEKLIGERTSRKEAFDIAIKNGDQSLGDKKYDAALGHYRNALSLLPGEKYPALKMEEITAITGKQKESDENYRKFIAEADNQFKQNKYEDAISTYTKALELKPEEAYPQQKITEAQEKLSATKNKDQNYASAIASGDQLLSELKYAEALDAYKQALALKPAEAYPSNKTGEINKILAKQKSDSDKYSLAKEKGDQALASGNYSLAINSFQEALAIKPTEQYPKDKITEINTAVALQKQNEEKYATAIKTGDQLLAVKDYSRALAAYTEASELKKNEKYPQDQIARINKTLGDLKSVDENYTLAVTEGDKDFDNQKFYEAMASYKKASALKPAETYPKSQVEKINATLAAQTKLDGEYATVLASADNLLAAKKYEDAIVEFRKALTLKPSDKYPSDKIAEAEKQIADLNILQEKYDKAIAEGDRKLAAEDYENALSSFKTANTLKPAETYALQKIAEIQTLLDKQKAENASYKEAIAVADKFFANQKYREALEPYQRASTIKSGEKYPQDQIIQINTLLAEQKKQDEEYQKLVTDAELQFKAGNYNDARSLYSNAGTLKPMEKLPQDKIGEIDGILAALKLKEENYSKATQTAAELYAAKNLAGAITSYEKAQAIKPSEKYPQERIAAIKDEIRTVDENYAKAIALGDSKLSAKELMEALNAYQNASEIKPGEVYPKTKIAEINSSLLAQKEELEKMYSSYIAEGDQLFGAKDYSGANSAFAKATGIKPNETYPKQRIIEIAKIVEEIELARRAEYNKALGEADKLYNTKVFDQAIDAYEAASKINPNDSYPGQQIDKIRKYMSEHAIQDLYSQALVISEGNEKKFSFSVIEPRLRKNNYILLKARSTGKTAPKVYLNYGKDNTKNGGIVLRSLDKSAISDYLIRISVQDKWYREDNNWISLSVETGDIEITKVQIAAGDE